MISDVYKDGLGRLDYKITIIIIITLLYFAPTGFTLALSLNTRAI